MRYFLRLFVLTSALIVAFLASSASLLAQEDASAPAPDEASSPASETPPSPAPVDPFLQLEKTSSAKAPELFAELKTDEKFTRRLPNYWRSLKPTKKQTDAIYALQLDYFKEITKLRARILRLETERDARMRSILTEKQRAALDAKLAAVEQERAAKEAEKEAAEEAETAE